MKKFFKLKKGFTLIEMLIVVAIIGVLVLIFAPSFNVFGKANGTSLNAKSKSVSNAVFQFMAENNNAYPTVTPVTAAGAGDAVLGSFTTPTDLANLIGSATAPRLSTVLTNDAAATLLSKLLPFTYIIDTTKISKYLKGSAIVNGDYFVVSTAGTSNALYTGAQIPQYDALDGTILSKVTIKDSDANYYNGVLKNK